MAGFVSTLLQRYLGEFLEGLTKENLKISLLAGIVTQKNVRFRPEALRNLNLPVVVKAGSVELLSVHLPSLGNLSTQATRIVLDDVFIVAGPGHATVDDQFDQRLLETKKRKLQVAEALKSDLEEEGKPGWFGRSSVGRLAESMVQNLTVHVNRVHVRYEDVDAQGEPFAAGITLEALQAEAAGPDWRAAVGELIEGAFRKLVSLRDLSMYWDRGSKPLVFENGADMARQMAALVCVEGMADPPRHTYVLPPVSGSAKFTFNLNYETSLKPQVQIAFAFDAIALMLGDRQWRQLTRILDGVSSEIRGIQYRKLRPTELPETEPRKWWQFAIGSILSDVRKKAEMWTWKWIEDFAADRKAYVGLWYAWLRSGKKKGSLTAAQRQSKKDIVRRRTFEQIMSFRSIAESLLLRQRELAKKALAATNNPFKRSKLEAEIMDVKLEAMSATEWADLRQSLQLAEIGEDRFHANRSNMKPDYLRQDISFELKGVSVTLLDQQSAQVARPIVNLALTTVAATFRGREDGTSELGAMLGSLQMTDWFTRGGGDRAMTIVHPTSVPESNSALDSPLVQVEVVLLSKGPRKVHITARALDVVFSIPLVLRIRDFFAAGGASQALVHLREDAVSAAARAIMTKAKIPTHLSVKIDAPNVVFCDDFAHWPNCTRLVGALGQLTLSSTDEDVYQASITSIRASLAFPTLDIWQEALQRGVTGKPGLWTRVLQETSLGVDILIKHGLRVHSDTTICCTGTFSSVPRIEASKKVVVDIVRVSLGLALSALQFDMPEGDAAAAPVAPTVSKTAVEVLLLMPSIEIVAATLSEDARLTKLLLDDTSLRVYRDFDGRVDVSLGLGSLMAVDLTDEEHGVEPPRMVWSEASGAAKKHVELLVTSWPGDGAVEVNLHIYRINLALQRQTALEVLQFTEALALGIVASVPPELRAKKSANPNNHNLSFNLTTGDVSVVLLKRGSHFLNIGISASQVKLQQYKDDRMHLELFLGAFCVEDPTAQGPYGQVLVTSGEHTAAIVLNTFPAGILNHPGHDFAIQVRVFSVSLVFLSRLLKDVSLYFSELGEMMALLRDKAGQAAAKAVRSAVRLSLKLDLEAVTVLVPAGFDDKRCFLARVHQMALAARPDGHVGLVITKVTAGSALFVRNGEVADLRPVLHEWSTSIEMERAVGDVQWGQRPDLSIACMSDNALKVSIDADQISLMFDVLDSNLLLHATPDILDESLNTTVNSVRRQFKSSFSPATSALMHSASKGKEEEDEVVVAALPVWVRVRVRIGDAYVAFGAAEGVALGSLRCSKLRLDLDAFDQLTVEMDLGQALLQDERAFKSGVVNLLEPVGTSNLLELRFRRALGELDDLGLTVGEMRAVLDPKWLLALVHIALPVLDRMLCVREKMESEEESVSSSSKKPVKQTGEGTHLMLRIKGPQVITLEDDSGAMARAVALSASLIQLERTEVPSGESAMELRVVDVELWKTRYSTDERASILFPVLVSLSWEEVSEEVASLAVTVGAMNVDFSYQDLILTHAVATYWLGVWGEENRGEKEPLEQTIQRPRQLSQPPPVEDSPKTPTAAAIKAPPAGASFRLELASNRAYVASVHDHPPRLTLEKRSDLSVQLVHFMNGRVVFGVAREASWCLTVEGPPRSEASVFVAQSHPAKATAQLWDWLPGSSSSASEGRLVLRSHPSWCLAVAEVGSAAIEESLPFELEQASEEGIARQLWHVPLWVAQAMPVASPSPLVEGDNRFNQQQQQRLQQKLVLPDRWAQHGAPARAQQVSLHLAGGLHLRVVDDLAGNVRPIARLAFDETSIQMSNWSNGGDLHCVFTLTMQADYFNEDSEAWEPLLRGMEDVTSPNAREKSLDMQMSVNRPSTTSVAENQRAILKATVMASQAICVTVSRALVPTAIRLWEAWDDRKLSAHQSVSRPAPLPPKLSNQTGQTIRWRGIKGLRAGEGGTLESGEAVDLVMNSVHKKGVVGLRIGDGRWLVCPTDAVTSHTFRLDDGLTAVVEVEKLKNGGREVRVRTNVVLENMTDHPIVIRLEPREIVVRPGATCPIPFDALHLPLRLCPDTQMYMMSDRSLVTGTLLQRTPEKVDAKKAVAPGSATSASVGVTREACDVFRCRHTLGGASWTWAVEVVGSMTNDSARAWTWRLRCRAPLTLRNLLQGTTQYKILVPGSSGKPDDFDALFEGELLKGGSVQLHRVGVVESLFLQVKVSGYRWSSAMRLGGATPSRGTRLGTILLDHVVEGGARTVSMFSSYWLVNDTGAPCVWYDAVNKKEIPGQQAAVATATQLLPLGLDGPPSSWFRDGDESLREPVLFWEGAALQFLVGRGKLAAMSGQLRLGGTVGAMGAMSVEGPNKSKLEFGVQVFNAPGEFWRTKIVQLSNRFVLVNVTGRPLLYGQMDAAQEFSLPAGSQVPFHWASLVAPQLLRIRFDDGEWGWSGGFSLKDASLFEVMLRERESLQSNRVVVQAVNKGPTTAILFHSTEGRTPMYSIRNNTSVPLLVKQEGVYDAGEEIPPRTTVPFAWADFSAPERRVQVLPVAGSKVEVEAQKVPLYSLDEVASLPSFRVMKKGWRVPVRCSASLFLSGATKVLAIEEEGGEIGEDDFEQVAVATVDWAISVSIPGVSLSLVSGAPAEIFHAFLDVITLDIEAGQEQQTLEFNVSGLQVDNQLRNKVYETVLWGRASENKPFFHLAVNRGLSGNGNDGRMLFFNGIEVVVQEITITLDEAFVTHLLQAAYDLLEYLDRSLHQDIVRRTPDYTRSTLVTNDMVYARILVFGPVAMILSYSSCPWGAASLKGDVVEKVLTALGPVSGLERAALQLNSLRLDNAFATQANMVQLIVQHYSSNASSKFLKLLGSAHFIGSPITLVESIGTGFWDLWYEPVLGLTHSPQAFAEGVEKGTRSMLSKTVYGVAKSASEITGSFGNVTAQLSFDPKYIENRERERKQQAQGVGEGLAYGVWDFGKGLFDGVTGLVTRPVQGGQEEGAKGFFKGVGQALSGVVVKPIAGTFGMVSRITEGVKNSANRATVVQRVRLPRFIGADRVITSFDAHAAEGQEMLWRLEDGAFQADFYVFHFPPLDAISEKSKQQRPMRLLASNRHLFYLCGTTTLSMQVVWKCTLLGIGDIRRSQKEGVLINLKSGNVSLSAPQFHSYEVSYLCLVLQRLVREAQGQRDNAANWDAVSAPVLFAAPLPGHLSGLDEHDEAESDFVVV